MSLEAVSGLSLRKWIPGVVRNLRFHHVAKETVQPQLLIASSQRDQSLHPLDMLLQRFYVTDNRLERSVSMLKLGDDLLSHRIAHQTTQAPYDLVRIILSPQGIRDAPYHPALPAQYLGCLHVVGLRGILE
jgi:hypothetical protein